ncbi:uncharacterized protein LOC111808425 [Cucurbita pepo subsp. pepo]|uniref:uncharacterized protein LOC111808425 n=1 Tax=Cucurbita pepo subsp. pepo TaxID=3664 RepID=UPI000C9D29F2|nr:uncharacterized protein LOC111808425 [Cucurbita pepo subsp. pepo]
MEDYDYQRNFIPTFGNWEWNDHLPFTQCFEASRIAGYPDVRDLYVAGDLYQNDVVTPAMIVVPRPRRKRDRHGKQEMQQKWTESPPQVTLHPPKPMPKPVDEDLYKISPNLCAKPKKKRGLSYITSCFVPTCLI